MFLLDHPVILGILIAAAAVVFGSKDLLRFRLRRVRAIAGVGFAESIRRRVLWVTPLAILGVVVVSQLQKPMDEQDAIRQTTKYCLFAAGLIVTVAAVILACTSLPREIENKVIFTIVTKPTTRLEIVLGKVLGFAGVSGLILLIMGVFTWGYLQIRSAALLSHVRDALAAGDLEPGRRSTLEHYQNVGLLSTKSLELPSDVQIAARVPSPYDTLRWMAGGQAQYFAAPFSLTEADLAALGAALNSAANPDGTAGAALRIRLQARAHEPTPEEKTELKQGSFPREAAPLGPAADPKEAPLIPQVAVQITNAAGNSIDSEVSLQKALPDPKQPRQRTQSPTGGASVPMTVLVPLGNSFLAGIEAQRGSSPTGTADFNVEVQGLTPSIEYGVDKDSTQLVILNPGQPGPKVVGSSAWGKPGVATLPKVLARVGRSGMQLIGTAGAGGSVAVFRFHDVPVPRAVNGKVAFQVKVAIDSSGDLDATRDATSEVGIQVRNHSTGGFYPGRPGTDAPGTGQPADANPAGPATAPRAGPAEGFVTVKPETGLASFVEVPLSAVAPRGGGRGDFDVVVRGLTPGGKLGLQGESSPTPSIALVTADHSFTFNLFKSLLILWLLSVLVVALSVFCSTFLSWPVAIVLTLLLLMGRWGVEQLGDSLAPGRSRGIAVDVFGVRNDPTRETAVTNSLELLSAVLRNAVKVLPDVSEFPAFEDIERGVDIRPAKLGGALAQTFGFGAPVILLTYLILRRKEVAP